MAKEPQVEVPKPGSLESSYPSFYPLTEADFKELWAKGTFILDANVLLNLHRYPQKARDDLFTVLGSLKGRVWVPYQVGLEYQRNRLTVIADQKHRFAEVREVLDEFYPYVIEQLQPMQLEKRHSAIDPTSFLEKLKAVLGDFRQTLSKLEERQPDVFQEDRIRKQIEEIVAVGPPPATQEDLQQLCSGGDERHAAGMPPGFRDQKKQDSKQPIFTHGGLRYERRHGDLILWRQILKFAKQAKVVQVIFITDDDKEDWWAKEAGKVIGPRPELRDEMRREAGVRAFHMYNSDRFLRFARDYLQVKIAEETITQVKEVRESVSEAADVVQPDRVQLREAVKAWLNTESVNLEAVAEPFLHFIAGDVGGNRQGVFVRVYDPASGSVRGLRSSISAAQAAAKRLECSGAHVVIAVKEPAVAEVARQELGAYLVGKFPTTKVTIGCLQKAKDTDRLQFDPVGSL